MGGNDISHNRDTPGSPDQRGSDHPITRGAPYPKRDGPWEHSGAEESLGEARGRFYPYVRKLRRNSTISIKTPGRATGIGINQFGVNPGLHTHVLTRMPRVSGRTGDEPEISIYLRL